MAIFPSSAEDAVKASIGMLQGVAAYNQTGKLKFALQIGVGLHTGTLMLGAIGDHERMDGTVISDTVNLASRLEGLTKQYGASLLISDFTRSGIANPDHYPHRFLGKIQVKGKKEAISIYEIYAGGTDGVKSLKMTTQTDFGEGLHHYFAKEFVEAAGCFKRVLTENPADKTAQLYLERSAYNMVHGVSEDWQGIEIMNRK